jgi:hypothetical protein
MHRPSRSQSGTDALPFSALTVNEFVGPLGKSAVISAWMVAWTTQKHNSTPDCTDEMQEKKKGR